MLLQQISSNSLPLSVYHLGFPINSFTSSTILSPTPFSSTTDDKGRRRLGNPKGLHSAPRAVYITVRPSSCFKASSRAVRTQIQVVQNFKLILRASSRNCRTFCPLRTFLEYVKKYLPVSTKSSKCDRLPRSSSVQVHHLFFSGSFHSDPLPSVPESTQHY